MRLKSKTLTVWQLCDVTVELLCCAFCVREWLKSERERERKKDGKTKRRKRSEETLLLQLLPLLILCLCLCVTVCLSRDDELNHEIFDWETDQNLKSSIGSGRRRRRRRAMLDDASDGWIGRFKQVKWKKRGIQRKRERRGWNRTLFWLGLVLVTLLSLFAMSRGWKARVIRDCLELSSRDARMDSFPSSLSLLFFSFCLFLYWEYRVSNQMPVQMSLDLPASIHPSISLSTLFVSWSFQFLSPCGPEFPSSAHPFTFSSFSEQFYEDTLRPLCSSTFTMSWKKRKTRLNLFYGREDWFFTQRTGIVSVHRPW